MVLAQYIECWPWSNIVHFFDLVIWRDFKNIGSSPLYTNTHVGSRTDPRLDYPRTILGQIFVAVVSILNLPICLPLMKRLGTDFWPDRSCRAFCMSAPIGPMVSNSTAVKSILFCLKTVFIFVQNGHVVLENTITLLSLMSWATAALGSSPFTTGGMVVVERLQDVVEIKLRLKMKMGDCHWCFR